MYALYRYLNYLWLILYIQSYTQSKSNSWYVFLSGISISSFEIEGDTIKISSNLFLYNLSSSINRFISVDLPLPGFPTRHIVKCGSMYEGKSPWIPDAISPLIGADPSLNFIFLSISFLFYRIIMIYFPVISSSYSASLSSTSSRI